MAKFTLDIEDYDKFYNLVDAALINYRLYKERYFILDEEREFIKCFDYVYKVLEPIKKCVEDLKEIKKREERRKYYLELKKEFEGEENDL